jgi:hypothetical protein
MKKNYFKNLMQVSLLLGAAFVISSCDDVIGQEDNPVASYVQWKANTPEEVTLKIGKTYTVQATAVSSAIVVYESENPEIAKVDPVTGVITAVAAGETNINAVVSGISTTGQSVFTPEKVSIKVIVKDGKASLTRAKDAVIEYTANKDSIIDLSKLFTAYPEATTSGEADKSTVTYSVKILNKAATTADKYETYSVSTKLGSKTATSTFKVGPEIEKKNYNKAICDTLYVIGQITSTNGTEYTLPTGTTAADLDIVMDTVKVIINKSIAYINAKGEREILTADKYKEVNMTDTEFDNTFAAGTYFITAANTAGGTPAYTTATDIKGDVTLIFANNVKADLKNIDDKTDNATLNIFGEAIATASSTPAKPEYEAWEPAITLSNYPNAITNFKAVNIYAGTFTVDGTINLKDLNVYGGTLNAGNALGGLDNAIKVSGKLTVDGGAVNAIGHGSDTENGFAIIGDVVVNKGGFTATNADYRAVKGNLTAGSKIKFQTSADGTTWADLTTATTNEKYIKAVAK